MKKYLAIITAVILVCVMSGAALAASTPIVIKVGTVANADGSYTKGLMEMKRLLNEYVGDAIDLQIFHSGQLGNERDMVEAVGMGSLEACATATGMLTSYKPDFFIFDFPFLFKNLDKAWTVFDGQVGRAILDELDSIGIKGMSFWANGFFHYINTQRDIRHPADLKGLKMRSMENEIIISTYESLGATPSPMSISDFSTAVRQGTIDGTNNAYQNISQFKWYETIKHMTLSYSSYSPGVFIINKAVYDSMPEDIRKAFDKAEREAALWERNYINNLEVEAKKEFQDAGVVIIEDVDINEWQEAVAPIYEKYKSRVNAEYLDAFLAIK